MGICEGDDVLGNEHVKHLNKILPKALDKLAEIINDETWDVETNQKFVAIQRQAAKDVVDSALKLQEQLFRVKGNNLLEKIYNMVQEDKKALNI